MAPYYQYTFMDKTLIINLIGNGSLFDLINEDALPKTTTKFKSNKTMDTTQRKAYKISMMVI